MANAAFVGPFEHCHLRHSANSKVRPERLTCTAPRPLPDAVDSGRPVHVKAVVHHITDDETGLVGRRLAKYVLVQTP